MTPEVQTFSKQAVKSILSVLTIDAITSQISQKYCSVFQVGKTFVRISRTVQFVSPDIVLYGPTPYYYIMYIMYEKDFIHFERDGTYAIFCEYDHDEFLMTTLLAMA
jgi:hypothetical protein